MISCCVHTAGSRAAMQPSSLGPPPGMQLACRPCLAERSPLCMQHLAKAQEITRARMSGDEEGSLDAPSELAELQASSAQCATRLHRMDVQPSRMRCQAHRSCPWALLCACWYPSRDGFATSAWLQDSCRSTCHGRLQRLQQHRPESLSACRFEQELAAEEDRRRKWRCA